MFPIQSVPVVTSPGGQVVQANDTLTSTGSAVFVGFGAGSVSLIINVTASPTGTSPTLQYTIQEVDPGDDTTVFGSTATSTSITGIGIQTITLSGVKGGAIKVTWTLGGGTPSFTGVYTTLGQAGSSGSGSVDQGTAAALSGAWPVKVTDGTNVLGTNANPVRTDPTGTTTQPVSATSLPLPTGAATSANQTTLGSQTTKINDGTNTAAVTGANALKVDGSAVTQPVSGTVTANIGTTNGLALDNTLTGGTAKAIVRGGAKGATTAADVTSTAEGTDHQALDVQIYHGGTAKDPTQIRALTSSDVVTAAQGTAAALSGYWPVRVTDGTNSMPTGDAVARALFHKVTDGTNTAAVKAASTAAVATDPALVVAVSPNNPVATTPSVVGAHANAWNAAAVSANGTSASVDCQYAAMVTAFGNVNGNTTLSVQVSQDDTNYYTASTLTISGGASDFAIDITTGARYVRLKSSQARTITATIAAKD